MAATPAVRRRRRAAASTLRRLGRFLEANFRFPGLDVDALTRALYDLLREAGLEEVAAAGALRARPTSRPRSARPGRWARRSPAIGARSVGAAALVELAGQPVYAWYASWLLSDEDLPLLGLSDYKNAARLIITIRDSAGEVPAWLREKFTPAQLQTFAGVADRHRPDRKAEARRAGGAERADPGSADLRQRALSRA